MDKRKLKIPVLIDNKRFLNNEYKNYTTYDIFGKYGKIYNINKIYKYSHRFVIELNK